MFLLDVLVVRKYYLKLVPYSYIITLLCCVQELPLVTVDDLQEDWFMLQTPEAESWMMFLQKGCVEAFDTAKKVKLDLSLSHSMFDTQNLTHCLPTTHPPTLLAGRQRVWHPCKLRSTPSREK